MKSSRKAYVLYTGSIFLLVLLVAGSIAISAADLIIQALADRTDSGNFDYRNLVVVGGGYVLLAIASLLFSCSRVLSVRSARRDIPKQYVPVKRNDIPKKIYTRIQAGFDEVQIVRKVAEPLPQKEKHTDQSKPNSPTSESLNLESYNLKQILANSARILENAVQNFDSNLVRKRNMSMSQFIEGLIQKQLVNRDLGQVYISGYERARYSKEPISHDEYVVAMRHLAVILRDLGYQLHSSQTNNGSITTSQSTVSSISSPARSMQTIDQQSYWDNPRDDDVISLSRSIATWSSQRSTSYAPRAPWNTGTYRSDANREADNEENTQHVIYQQLMHDRSA